ncbi:MAG: hypothetical protein AAF355_07065 [Myxococcota bacterium]
MNADSHATEIQAALEEAGLEIYTSSSDEIQIAERIRLHIMDSGIRLVLGDPLRIRFTARCQRADFPNESAETLFTRVRDVVGKAAGDRGYEETGFAQVEVKNPVDDSKILDVWHEVTYEKSLPSLAQAVPELRWALKVEKYVSAQETPTAELSS